MISAQPPNPVKNVIPSIALSEWPPKSTTGKGAWKTNTLKTVRIRIGTNWDLWHPEASMTLLRAGASVPAGQAKANSDNLWLCWIRDHRPATCQKLSPFFYPLLSPRGVQIYTLLLSPAHCKVRKVCFTQQEEFTKEVRSSRAWPGLVLSSGPYTTDYSGNREHLPLCCLLLKSSL